METPSSTPIILTEIMDTTLDSAYKQYTLSNPVKQSIMMDVAAALNYLHLLEEPIIYRDVSSSNILLQALPNNFWRAKLCDFGSANLACYSNSPAPGKQVYSAPEILPNSACQEIQQLPSMDVYSFGVLLVEVFSEEFPFPGRFSGLLQSLSHGNLKIHQLATSCIKQNTVERPSMTYVLTQLHVHVHGN